MKLMVNGQAVTGTSSIATNVAFNNSTSGLESTNLQSAVDEINSNVIQNKTDLQGSIDSVDTRVNEVDSKINAVDAKVSGLSNLLDKRIDYKNWQVDEGKDLDLSDTVTESGLYLVVFFVRMCGGNAITKPGAAFSVSENNTSGFPTGRKTMNILIASKWDEICTASVIMRVNPNSSFTFYNCTGVATNAEYYTAVGVNLIKLAD